MFIHHLQFAGIGPFPGEHAIDFVALGSDGIFLLEGPTGSGKSTVLDAIVYALYGQVASDQSSRDRMVSTHRAPGVTPYVDLVFETANGVMRVRRTPEYQRPKARGSGMTTEKASISLWRLEDPLVREGDSTVLVSSHIQEANAELCQAVGLTREQFTRTVILPQGEFAQFLKSKPEERRELLQDIFGTELYEEIARALHMAARGAKERQKERQATVNARLAAYLERLEASGDAQPDGLVAAVEDREVEALGAALDALSAQSRQRLTEVERRSVEADRAAAEAAEAHAAAADLQQRLAERAALVARAAALDAGRETVAQLAARVESAERATRVRVADGDLRTAEAELEARLAALDELRVAAADTAVAGYVAEVAPEPSSWESATSGALRQGADRLNRAAGALEAAAALEEAMADREESLTRAREALDAAILAVDAEHAEASARTVQREELVRRRQDASVVATGETEAELTLRETTRRAEAVARVAQVRDALAEAREVEDQREAQVAQAVRAHGAARAAWLDNLAGTLASELAHGVPCPVCGSAEHPSPATVPDGVATREDVERLEREMNEAHELLRLARTSTHQHGAELELAAAETGGRSAEQARDELVSAVETREAVAAAKAEATELTEQIEALDVALDEGRARRESLLRIIAEDRASLAERMTSYELDLLVISEARGEYASVIERHAATVAEAKILSVAAELLDAGILARDQVAERRAALESLVSEMGFASRAQALDALVEPETLAEWRQVVGDHARDSEQVAALLGQPRLQIASVDPPDLEAAKGRAEETRAGATLALELAARVRHTHEELTRAGDALVDSLRALVDSIGDSAAVLRMADLAAAGEGNVRQVTLPTFVLLRRFEEVLDHANSRLATMTSGRYELRRTDVREKREQKLGLGLEVVDHVSGGLARDPATLSGGETFMASLALALGLADAVTAEAGGVELGTLFVDEGFGSLDPESLDLVMRVLNRLRDGGRVVGVVSHVAEMKQQISSRVEVRRRADGIGSTLTTTAP